MDFVGKSTLILLGLNGLFHEFVNLHICTKINHFKFRLGNNYSELISIHPKHFILCSIYFGT